MKRSLFFAAMALQMVSNVTEAVSLQAQTKSEGAEVMFQPLTLA